MNLPTETDHTEPVRDSRGLVLTPAGMPWARESRPPLVLAPSASPCPTLPAPGPCETCGQTAPWLYFSIEQGRDVYGCSVKEGQGWECAGRALEAKRAADRAQAIGQAQAPKALPAPASTPRSRPKRPSQVRKTLLGQAAAKAPKNPPGVPADPAPGTSGAQDPAGGAA